MRFFSGRPLVYADTCFAATPCDAARCGPPRILPEISVRPKGKGVAPPRRSERMDRQLHARPTDYEIHSMDKMAGYFCLDVRYIPLQEVPIRKGMNLEKGRAGCPSRRPGLTLLHLHRGHVF